MREFASLNKFSKEEASHRWEGHCYGILSQHLLTIPVPKMAHRIRSSSGATGMAGIWWMLDGIVFRFH